MQLGFAAQGFVTRCNATAAKATEAPMASTVAPPNHTFIEHDPSFRDVLGPAPALERVVDADAHEGPVYAADEDALYYTTPPHDLRVAIKRLALADRTIDTVREPARMANGMTLGPDGRLLVCEQGSSDHTAAIAAIDRASGARETLVESWRGAPFNSPNDVLAASDGSIWFTDPSYGFLQGFRPEPQVGDYVYRFDPASGRVAPVADDLDKPNGLAFSPDESVLYVGDSGANQTAGSYHPDRPHHVLAYELIGGRHLGAPRLLAVVTPGFPDGLKVDSAGRVYTSSFSGVQIFDPSGDLIGEIALPGAVNFTFGGRDRNVLFITADTAIWAAHLQATGP
jgi:gluconolactonase